MPSWEIEDGEKDPEGDPKDVVGGNTHHGPIGEGVTLPCHFVRPGILCHLAAEAHEQRGSRVGFF